MEFRGCFVLALRGLLFVGFILFLDLGPHELDVRICFFFFYFLLLLLLHLQSHLVLLLSVLLGENKELENRHFAWSGVERGVSW